MGTQTNAIQYLEQKIEQGEVELTEKRARAEQLRNAGNASSAQAEEAASRAARALVDNDETAGTAHADVEAAASRAARNAREATRIVEREIESLMARLASDRIALEAERQEKQRNDVQSATSHFLALVSAAAIELEAITAPSERIRLGEELAKVFGKIDSFGMAPQLGGREWKSAEINQIPSTVAVGRPYIATPPRGDWDDIELGPMVAVGLLCGADLTLPPPHVWISAPAGYTLNVPLMIAERLVKLGAAVRLDSRSTFRGDEKASGALSDEELLAHRKSGACHSRIDSRRHVTVGHPRTWPSADAAAAAAEPSRAASSVWGGRHF